MMDTTVVAQAVLGGLVVVAMVYAALLIAYDAGSAEELAERMF